MLTLHGLSRRRSKTMAFVRRKGNAYYLVHNVRRGGKVKQLHLASLGERPRITNDVVKLVEKKHPFVDLDFKYLREQVNSSVNLFDPQSPSVQKLVSALRTLNLDLADLFPPVLNVSGSPEVGYEILTQQFAAPIRRNFKQRCAKRSWGRRKRCSRWWICTRCSARG